MSNLYPAISLSNYFGTSAQSYNYYDTKSLQTLFEMNYHANRGAQVVTGMNMMTGTPTFTQQQTQCVKYACINCINNKRLQGYCMIQNKRIQCLSCNVMQ